MKVSPIFSLITVVFVNLFIQSVSHPILQSIKLGNVHSPCLPDLLMPWDSQAIEGVWYDLARTNYVYKANTWTNGMTNITFQADSMQIDYQGFDKESKCQFSSLQLNRSQVDHGFLYIDKMELDDNAISVVAVCLEFSDVLRCKEDGHFDLFVWSRNSSANVSSDELKSRLTTILEKYCISKDNMIFADNSSLQGTAVCEEPISDANFSSPTTTFIVADLAMQVATLSAGEQVEDNLVKGTTPTIAISKNSTLMYYNETTMLTTGLDLQNQTRPNSLSTLAKLNKTTQTNKTQNPHVDEINVSVLIEPIAKENTIEKDLLTKMNHSQANAFKPKEFNSKVADELSQSASSNQTDEQVDLDESLSFSNSSLPIISLKKQIADGHKVNSSVQENSNSLNSTQSETFAQNSTEFSQIETSEAAFVSKEASHESTLTTNITQVITTIATTSTSSTDKPIITPSVELDSSTVLNTESSTVIVTQEDVNATDPKTETQNSTIMIVDSTSIGTTGHTTTETTTQIVLMTEAVTQISVNVTETLLGEPSVKPVDLSMNVPLNLSKKSDLDEESSLMGTVTTTTQSVSESMIPEQTTIERTSEAESVSPVIDVTSNETQSFLIDSAPLDENVTQSELNNQTSLLESNEPSSNLTQNEPIEEAQNNATTVPITEGSTATLSVDDVIILTTFETHVITSEDDEHEEDNHTEKEISTDRPAEHHEEDEKDEEKEEEDEEERKTTSHHSEDHDDDDHEEDDDDDEEDKTKTTTTTEETTTTTTFLCVKVECQVKHCNFGRRRDEHGCENCDCLRDPTDSNDTQCSEAVCHPCFYGAYTDENGCESCACKPRPKPKNIYECPQLECASCNYGSIKDEYGCETCICIRPNSLERSYPCPPEPTCPFGACKHGSMLNDYGCATCDCLKSNEPEHDLECTRQRCEPCSHGYFTDADGCETCLCKPDWMAPCALVELSCDPTRECPYGTYLDRNGCPSCECLPDPTLKSDCYHMKEIDEQIECNSDGSFKPTQCNDEECRCVTKYGTPISQFKVNASDSDRMNCECALALYEISVYKAIGFKLYCLPNGNYETIQCVGGSCACVNEHGDPLGPSVPIYQKHLLRCEGVFQNVYEDQFVTTMAPITLTKPLCIYHQERAIEMSSIDAHLSIPNCDDRGLYAPLQCDRHNKYCWCVNVNNGVELYGSRRTADQKPECSDDEDD